MSTRPPGPAGLPVVGNSHQYARDPFRFMDGVRRAYGTVARFRLGPYETFMLSDPDHIERVLVSEENRFRKADFQDRAVEDLLGKGLLLSEGRFWRQQRQLAQPAFNPGRIADLVDMMAEKTAATLAQWEDGETIDIHLAMARLTVEVIVDAMFGTTIDSDLVATVQAKLDPLGSRFEPDPTRFLVPDWVPTDENREYRQALDTIEEVLYDLIEERREGTVEGDDLLSILLRAQSRGELTEKQLRDEMMTMLLAGHDTTALSLTYAWHQALCTPGVQDRLQAEADEVLGGTADGRPDFGSLRQLDYTERVVKEAMRVYPPVYTLFRQPETDVRMGSYRVPADSILMLPQWVVHRDPALWENPEQFDPDRFLPERAAARHNYAYFPFGAGPRHCIGKLFSLAEARVITSMMAHEFDFELASSETLDLRPSLTAHPANPVEVTLRRR